MLVKTCELLETLCVRVYRRPGHQTGGFGETKVWANPFPMISSSSVEFVRQNDVPAKLTKEKRRRKGLCKSCPVTLRKKVKCKTLVFQKLAFPLSTKDCQCVS